MKNWKHWKRVGASMMVVIPLAFLGCGGGGGGNNGGGNGTGGTTVSVAINGASWVAFQDGKNGSWRTLNTTGSNTAPLTDPAGRYSVAWVCPGDKTAVNIVHTTRSETPNFSATCGGATPPAEVNLTVVVNGLNSGNALTGVGDRYFVDSQTNAVAQGTYDVLSIRLDPAETPNRLWLERNKTFNRDTTYTVDFNRTDSTLVRVVDISAGTATVSDADPNETVNGRFFYASGNRSTIIGLGTLIGNGTLLRYPIIPSDVVSGALYRLEVTGTDRGVVLTRSNFGNTEAISLPAPFISPQFTSNIAGNVQITVSNLSYNETPYAYTLFLPQANVQWNVLFTRAWLNNDTTYTTPDLSALTGWNTNWSLQRGVQVEASVTVLVSDSPNAVLDNFLKRPATAEGQVRFAIRKQSIVP